MFRPFLVRVRLATVASLILTAGASALTVAAAEPRRPNIVLILADDLGYGDLGCFGQARIKTPRLDQLAREGMRFTQFYSGSTVCAPARNSLMTGEHTGHALIRGNAKIDLRATDTTIAEDLRDAGYATAIIGKWGLGRTGTSGDPKARGFDHAFGYVDQTHAHNYFPSFLVRDGERVPLRNVVPDEGPYGQGVATTRVDFAPDLFIADAMEFIRAHQASPFFLYFATTLPHANNEGRDRGMEIPDHGTYADTDWPETEKGFAAMVTRLDTDVGRIIDEIDRLGLGGDTLIFFTSDNGPHAEGGHDADYFDSNGPLRGRKRDLYEGGIRVPTIARWTGRIAPDARSEFIGAFPDLRATLAELAGLGGSRAADGISIAPTLLASTTAQPQHDALYWEFHEGGKTAQAVRLGRWKAIRAPIGSGPVELYDLDTDPGETTDRAREQPAIVERAVETMGAMRTTSAEWPVGG